MINIYWTLRDCLIILKSKLSGKPIQFRILHRILFAVKVNFALKTLPQKCNNSKYSNPLPILLNFSGDNCWAINFFNVSLLYRKENIHGACEIQSRASYFKEETHWYETIYMHHWNILNFGVNHSQTNVASGIFMN